jgi:hypothetical protein
VHGGAIAYVGGPGRRRGQGGAAARSGGGGEDEAEQPVSNTKHRHRLKLPIGAFVMGTWRHRVIARPGAIVCTLGTGWCHQPVPIPPCSFGTGWYRLVAPPSAYSRVLVPGGGSTRYQNPSL